MSEDGLADIVRLPYADDDALESPVDHKGKDYGCRHRFIVLDDESHRIYCDEGRCQGCGARPGTTICKCPQNSWYRRPGCGIELDAWEWIKRTTSDWRDFTRRYRDAKLQAAAAEERLSELRRQEANTKARLRRAREQLKAVSPGG